jgi:hypothetical protein
VAPSEPARPARETGSPEWAEAYREHGTEIAIRMGRFFVQHLIDLYRAFDGDLVSVIILGEIGHHNTTRSHAPARTPGRSRASAKAATPGAPLLPCNAFSLSQATGIPRETVRRKIAALVRRGWVRQNARGEVFVTPAAAAHFTPDFNRVTLNRLLTLADELRALLTPAGPPPRAKAAPRSPLGGKSVSRLQ